jgi:hypothetical protein
MVPVMAISIWMDALSLPPGDYDMPASPFAKGGMVPLLDKEGLGEI